MLKNCLKKNSCWILSGIVLFSLASCGEKPETTSDDSSKKTVVEVQPEPLTKEVPVPGQMGAHGDMSGAGMAAHGNMGSAGMAAHGNMGSAGMGGAHGMMGGGNMGAHGGMGDDLDAKDLAQPFQAKRKSTRTVEVSDEVKEKWKKVSIQVRDKQSGKADHFQVKINSEFTIPETNIKIKVGPFLPHFSMPTGGKITSASNEPKNPALQVVIDENDTEKYSGWLFAKFPEMHAFEHEKYAISLDDNF